MMEYISIQRMPNWVMSLIIISGLSSIFIVGIGSYDELFRYLNGEDNSSAGQEIFFVLIGLVVMNILLLQLFILQPLRVKINKQGITYMCFPYLRKPRTLSWNEIKHIHVKEIHPLGDFGGWGYRIGPGRQGYIFQKGPALLMQTTRHRKTFALTINDGVSAKRFIEKYQPSTLKVEQTQ